MSREHAWSVLTEFTKSDSLRKHALAVEACLTAYARKLGNDEQKWSVTALLHDFDWEIHPNAPDHPMKGEPILAERGVDDDIRRAILSHANYSGVPRESAHHLAVQRRVAQLGMPITPCSNPSIRAPRPGVKIRARFASRELSNFMPL